MLDIADPRNPQIIQTRTTNGTAPGRSTVTALGNGFFAVSGTKFNDHDVLMVVDANNPQDVRFTTIEVPAAVEESSVVGNMLFTPSSAGLGIYDIGDVLGTRVAVQVQMPKDSVISVPVAPGVQNLTRRSGVTVTASSNFSGYPLGRAIDGNLDTSWFTAGGDAANKGTSPFFEVQLPEDSTITELRMFGNREFANGFDFFAGIFQLFAADGSVLFDSGIVNLPAPVRDIALTVPNIASVRRVRFTATDDESDTPGFAELQVLGHFDNVSGDLPTRSFSLPPTRVISGADFDTVLWDVALSALRDGLTITWQSRVNDLQPGEARDVVLGGTVDFTVPSGDSGQIDLPPVVVVGEQTLALNPASRTVQLGETAEYTLIVKNPTGSPVTYDLSVQGVPPSWVNLVSSVNVPAQGMTELELTLQSDENATPSENGFVVTANADTRARAFVHGTLILEGVPGGGGPGNVGEDVESPALGVVLGLTPSQATAGQGTAATFTVRVTNVGNEEDTYTLSGSFPSGFTGTFAEQQVTVLPGLSNFREVTLTVTPPPGTAVSARSFTVRATSTQDAGVQDDTTGSVNVVSQGVDVDITPSTGGPSTTFQMTVKNTGQSQDTFALQLGGPAGVSATLGTASVTLAPGASQTVPITLGSLNFALSGGLDLIGVGTSQANTTVKDQDLAQILIDVSKGLSVSITPTVVELPTPGAAAFLVQVDNTGNGEDAYKAEIMGTTGPVTAALNGLNRQPTQKIDLFRLPGLSTGGILLNATLTAPGEGKITVRVTSLTDASLTAQAVATVRTPGGGNHVPEVNAGADQKVIVRQLISLTATFTDADVNDTHTATVNWGDGTPVSGGTVTKNNGGGTVTASHSYLQPGKFTVTVCVKDNHDAQNCDTLVVTVVAAELAPFLCYQTKSSQGDVCAATAPKNAGKVCRTETDCGGHDGGEDDDDESRQSDDGDDDDGEETNFCAPRNFPHGLQLTLEDRFDTSLFEVRKPDDLCNPAVLNTKAPQDPTIHLRDFRLHLVEKQCLASAPRQAGEGCKKEEDCDGVSGRTRYCAAQPKFVPQKNLQVKNVFHPQGGLKLDLLKPEHLTLPAAKDHTKALPPPNPATHNVDPYTCYQAKLSQGTPQFPNNLRTRVVDQFAQEKLYDLQKPTRLCTPTIVEGDAVKDMKTQLMCYQVQPTPKVCTLQAPKNAGKVCGKETDCGGAQGQTTFCRAQPTHAQVKKVFVTTELLPEQVDTLKEDELCVPSEIMRTP